MDSRKSFEESYPLPENMYWDEEQGQYAGHNHFWIYSDRLEVWKAAVNFAQEQQSPAFAGLFFYKVSINSSILTPKKTSRLGGFSTSSPRSKAFTLIRTLAGVIAWMSTVYPVAAEGFNTQA